MSFVDTAEVARWSKIQIDADKDMLGFGLTNLKELALMMQVGDMLAFNAKTNQLAIISPGVASSELITRGNVWPPVWGYPDSGQIPTVQDLTVSTGSDDSSGFTGNYSNAAVNQVLGNSGGNHYNNAFRFLNVNIPATAMVTAAFLIFTAEFTRAGQNGISLTIKGEDSISPLTYGATEDFTLRTYLSTTVAYTPEAAWNISSLYYSADITAIIKALFAKYGAYHMGKMAFEILDSTGAGNDFQVAYSYDSAPLNAPVLYITYVM